MSKKLIVFPALLKAHVDTFTRKDGVTVQAHDTKVQAAQFNGAAVAKKHENKMVRKGLEWERSPSAQIPHADVAGAHEFSHKEVYGHDGKTSPAGTDFADSFAAKGHSHFVLKHPDGKRSFVNTEGGNYARYHAPVQDTPEKPEPRMLLPKKPAEAKTGSAAPAKEVNVGSEKWPMKAKSSEKLAAKKDDGSTHHVGGFEPPSDGKGDHLVHHDGKAFSFTGKSGKNTKTGEASYEFAHKGDGGEHRAWVTRSGHLQND